MCWNVQWRLPTSTSCAKMWTQSYFREQRMEDFTILHSKRVVKKCVWGAGGGKVDGSPIQSISTRALRSMYWMKFGTKELCKRCSWKKGNLQIAEPLRMRTKEEGERADAHLFPFYPMLPANGSKESSSPRLQAFSPLCCCWWDMVAPLLCCCCPSLPLPPMPTAAAAGSLEARRREFVPVARCAAASIL